MKLTASRRRRPLCAVSESDDDDDDDESEEEVVRIRPWRSQSAPWYLLIPIEL